MEHLIHWCICLLVGLVFGASPSTALATQNANSAQGTPVVVFVCEHGAAKSVVAAAHFNKLAIEGRISIRAIARATNPDPAISEATSTGLKADGLSIDIERPVKLAASDLVGAIRVVAMCDLSETDADTVRVEEWDDIPSVSDDYSKARDALVQKIKRLLEELKTNR